MVRYRYPSKHFVCLQDVFKTSSAKQFFVFHNVLKTSWRRLENTSGRIFENVLKTSCKTSWRRHQDVFARRLKDIVKTSWRRLGKQKIVTLKMCWRRLQDFLKASKCLLGTYLLFTFLLYFSTVLHFTLLLQLVVFQIYQYLILN